MKVLVVLALALAVASAYTVPDTPAFIEDQLDTPSIEGRITNGKTAAAGQFPYQVGLDLDGYWCGGSLIGQNWVLTAAQCTYRIRKVTVYLGSTSNKVGKVKFTVSSDSIYQHTGYNKRTFANDISLIRIPAVSYSKDIQPVKLPSISSTYSSYDGKYAIASGWGKTSDDSTHYSGPSSSLNFVRLQIISNSVCAKTYGTGQVTSNTICVGTPSGKSTCKGDTGGPLVLDDSSKVLVGISSYVSNYGCEIGSPAAFVRVSSYLNWIKDITGISY